MNFEPKLIQINKTIGTPVINLNGDKIGQINDVALYDRNGVVAYLVVELFDNNGGRKDELFAVPWDVFSVSEVKDAVIFTIDDKMLMNAPSFMKEDWVNADQANLIVAVYEHYELKNRLNTQVEEYNAAASRGLGESGKISSIEEKSKDKTTIERAGIRDKKKSYMY